MWMSGKPADPGFYWHRDGPDDDEPTVIELDMAVRAELNDQRIDHRTMSEQLIPRLEAAGAPVKAGGVTRELVEEILHWLDEALAMAGYSRDVRR